MADAVTGIQAIASVSTNVARGSTGNAFLSTPSTQTQGSVQASAQRQFELAMLRAEQSSQGPSSINNANKQLAPSPTQSAQRDSLRLTDVPSVSGASVSSVNSTLKSVNRFAGGLRDRFQSLQHDAMTLGEDFDIGKPSSVVLILERQMRITAASLEMQMVLQSAENIKHGVKSITQMQG